MTIIRQYPLYSPWIESLKVVHSFDVPRKRLYYMYDAPSNEVDPGKYAREIGARRRSDFYRWLLQTPEGQQYARDKKLKKKINFLGMRKTQRWAKKLADLYAATAVTRQSKSPYRNAKREMRWRTRLHPHRVA